MARAFTEDRLVIATHNPGKLREIGALLTPFGVAVTSAGELGLAEPVEDGDSFKANALIKARAAVDTSSSNSRMEPREGRRARYNRLSRDVLPAPDGPVRKWNEPWSRVKEMS